jgi:peptide/nickel transport system permease protein
VQRLLSTSGRLARIIGLRLAIAVPILVLVSIAAFSLVLLVPGEPALTLAGGFEHATPERIAEVREDLGLDDPLLEQYGRWLADAVRLDFGTSVNHPGIQVADELRERVPVTLSIGLFGLVAAVLIGLAAGAFAGSRPGTGLDKLSMAFATVGVSVPSFVIAIVLIRAVALEWDLFTVPNAVVVATVTGLAIAVGRSGPAARRARDALTAAAALFVVLVTLQWLVLGRQLLPAALYTDFGESKLDWLRSIILPGLALAMLPAGALSRQLRAGLVDSANADYVRTAWSVGSGPRSAMGKHALRNSAIPSVAVLGTQMSVLLGGTVVIERVFAIQDGIGTYIIEATLGADLPALRAIIMWYAVLQLAVYLFIDIVLVLLNPRVSVR